MPGNGVIIRQPGLSRPAQDADVGMPRTGLQALVQPAAVERRAPQPPQRDWRQDEEYVAQRRQNEIDRSAMLMRMRAKRIEAEAKGDQQGLARAREAEDTLWRGQT